jgi:hypothetical protein
MEFSEATGASVTKAQAFDCGKNELSHVSPLTEKRDSFKLVLAGRGPQVGND